MHTTRAYDAEGRAIATWGATYPVAYEYDASGRMTAMLTSRDSSLEISGYSSFILHPSSFDRTTWSYDQPTGLLTNKLYADGKGTTYTYTPDGKLATRAWARGVTTTYAYTNGSSLAAIAYSDSTPGVTFTYDRLGRMASATVAGVSTNLFTYDALDLVSETQNGVVITRTTDALGRPAGFSLSGSPYAVSYAYDAYGRFSAVTAQVHVLTHGYVYGYLPGSDLVETMANSHGHTVTRTYDAAMPRITRVHNGFTGGRTVSQYDYTYDALGRRTAVANSGEAFTFSNANDLAAFNLYGYNGRSEVASAARYWGTDTEDTSAPVAGQQYAYAFDPIGNRVTAAEGDTSRTAEYTANELNQYSQRTVPGVKELAGTALAEAAVTVNGLPADRRGPWWRHAFEADNASSAAYTQAVVTAVYSNLYSSATGHVFVAGTPEAFAYDHDGNLTRDGRFDYAWDAEHRLIRVTTRDDLPAGVPRVRVTHRYDHQSRRIATERETWGGSAWQPAGTSRYLYDGWNVVAETRSAAPANTNLYVWGLDLSGTLQGAGGIGGLLTVRKRLEDGTGVVRNYDYLFDANGNVVQEILRTDGAINAHYEYDPFGNTVVALRVDATDNPFRFSTKWFDNDTGLGYWGYRWYSPSMGRWLSRDPIGEKGGSDLYTFTLNASLNGSDSLGLMTEWAYDYLVGCNAAFGQIGDYYYVDHGPMANRTHESGAGNAIFLTHWCKNKGKWQLCNTETKGYLKVRVTECCELYNVRCQWVYSGESIIGIDGTPATSSANVGVGVWLTHGIVVSKGATNGGKTRRIQSTWNGVLEGMMSLPRGSWKEVAGFSLDSIAQGGKEASIDEAFSLRCSVSCSE